MYICAAKSKATYTHMPACDATQLELPCGTQRAAFLLAAPTSLLKQKCGSERTGVGSPRCGRPTCGGLWCTCWTCDLRVLLLVHNMPCGTSRRLGPRTLLLAMIVLSPAALPSSATLPPFALARAPWAVQHGGLGLHSACTHCVLGFLGGLAAGPCSVNQPMPTESSLHLYGFHTPAADLGIK